MAVDPRIVQNIEAGRVMEVSTGLFYEPVPVKGVWNGEAYSVAAGDWQPDHLALLPDKKGACSLADGAGLLVNEAGDELDADEAHELLQQSVGLTINRFVANITAGEEADAGLSHLIRQALKGGNLTANTQNTEKVMTRAQRIAALIAANEAYTDADTKWLTALNDEQFDTIESASKQPTLNGEGEGEGEGEGDDDEHAAPTGEQQAAHNTAASPPPPRGRQPCCRTGRTAAATGSAADPQ